MVSELKDQHERRSKRQNIYANIYAEEYEDKEEMYADFLMLL